MRHGTDSWVREIIFLLFCITVLTHRPALAQSDPDLPGAAANIEMIRAGSLIIPMDNTQSLNGTAFNLKAYGLVNALLHSNVPVKWSIAAGKAKDSNDFTAATIQILPRTVKSALQTNFTGGPFIVERAYTNSAWPVITNWGNNVEVFRLTNDTGIDIRYTLSHKPKVAVMADGAFHFIQTNVLAEAGFSTNDYKVLFAADLPQVGSSSCFTIVTAPHYDGNTNLNAQTLAIRGFLNSGGNVMCQCAAVSTYENSINGHFHTTAGITAPILAGPCQFVNADCAYNQFVGDVTNLFSTSAVSSWALRPGSVFTNSAYPTVYVSGTNIPYCAVAKIRPGQVGGCMFYLGGHDYGIGTTLQHYNGKRMMLNAIFVPADRPGECAVNFQTDLAVLQNDTSRTWTNGQQVTYTIIVTNQGPARVSDSPFVDIFPPEISNLTWSATFSINSSGSHTNGAGNINETFNIPINGSIIITATGTLATVGSCTLTNIATISTPASVAEVNPDDNASIHIDAAALVVSSGDAIACLGGTTTFSAYASGPGPIQLAWKRDGNVVSTESTLTIANVSASDAGIYTIEATGACGSATNTATLYIGDYMTAAPLTNIVACPNQQATFVESISNVPTAHYRWRKNANLIAGATNSSLIVNVANSQDAGTYTVEVSDGCISFTNSATLSLPTTGATAIFPLTRCSGQIATFTTLATGDGPFSYAWRKDGLVLVGETKNSLSITNVSTTNAGLYSVEVSGPCNTVTNSATLTVRTNVSLPALGNVMHCPGDSVTFKAAPAGTGPFTYRWRKNAILISGQASSNLVLNSVTTNDSGTYTVEVTGQCNSATNTGVLAVGANTTTTPMADESHCPNESAVFTTTPSGVGPFHFVWRRNGQIIDGETNDTLIIPSLPANMPPATITVEVTGQCSTATNSATLRVEDFIYVTNFVTFANTNPITIVDNQRANIYPSAIHVPCLWPQELTKVQVAVLGLSHTFPSDVCMMLVSPGGKATPLMINCGGGRDYGVNNVNVFFDSEGDDLPFASQLFSGTYRPTVYGTNVTFPNPAPLAPDISLDQFASGNCHGDWNLYVFDDRIIDSGSISGGWALTLFVTEAHAPYFVSPRTDDAGLFTMTLVGDANHPHRIESSTDFIHWSPIATNTLPEGTWLFTNSAPSTLLFYRAVRLP